MKCPKCQAESAGDARFCGNCGADLSAAKATAAEPKIDFGAMRTIDEADTRAPGKPADLLAPGTTFAQRYDITQVVGEGGMGVVYRAKDKVTEREVALKLIRSDRLGGKDAVKRLIREGVTSRDIRHPNVVAVYDVGEADGQPYMSMEFLDGKSLRAWNRERMQASADCSMKTAGRIIGQILDGLEAAHKAGVIHRDLKPENVMLLSTPNDEGVKLKILDFGIARVGGADTGASSLGTRGYMAPEQITAPDAAQASADLYSLSVMFYELLVGVVPQGHWQPPSGGRSDVSPKIDDLIQKGLSNNPKARPQSVADYRRLLEEGMQNAPGSAPGGLGGWTQAKPNFNIPQPPSGPPPQQTNRPNPQPTQPLFNSATQQAMQQSSKKFWEWFLYSFKQFVNGKGRAHRLEYWTFNIIATAFLFIGYSIDMENTGDYYGEVTPMFSSLAFLVFICPAYSLASRRMHDLNQNGWLAAFYIIPIVALIIGIPRGTVGDNQYGPDPLAGKPA